MASRSSETQSAEHFEPYGIDSWASDLPAALDEIVTDWSAVESPESYIRTIGLNPFAWQVDAVRPWDYWGAKDIDRYRLIGDRLLILAARQSGKSTIVAANTQHTARFNTNALNLVICPAKDQSSEVMQKVATGVSLDPTLQQMLVRDGITLKEFDNQSRIVALPGTERSVRGYSAPRTIILDEAARILDPTYMATRPMMTDTRTNLVAMSTAFGKRGWFYRAWMESANWRKILVRVPWDPVNGELVPAMPEEEFRAMWAERGVSAYYSPRHNKYQLQEELDEIGDLWFRQEYCCEFLDESGALFAYEDIIAAFNYEADQGEAVAQLLEEEQEREMEEADDFEIVEVY